jgi:hypothetical protein
MKGFSILSGHICGKEETAILNHCILNKIPYKICHKPEDSPEGYMPCGTVEWVEKFLPKEKTVPDYYPEFLKGSLYRSVWRTDTWPLGKKVFIKPADRHKRFTGVITSGGYRKKKRGPYWCSDIVVFTNEWRYYVADGKVLVGEWYSGDEVNEPDAPELNIAIPAGYCGALDFGTLTTGEFALVEANSPYACGWYGKKHELYSEWLIKGWKYLTIPQNVTIQTAMSASEG